MCLKKNLNACNKPSEHPPDKGGKFQNVLVGTVAARTQASSWESNGFPNVGSISFNIIIMSWRSPPPYCLYTYIYRHTGAPKQSLSGQNSCVHDSDQHITPIGNTHHMSTHEVTLEFLCFICTVFVGLPIELDSGIPLLQSLRDYSAASRRRVEDGVFFLHIRVGFPHGLKSKSLSWQCR